jgi:diguanylate cyclase (GGDEF)-like protein
MTESSGRERILVGAYAVLVVGVAVYAVSLVPGVRARPGPSVLFDEWLNSGIYIATATVVALRAALRSRNRPAWTILAIGLGAYAAGVCYYFIVQADLMFVPIPSVADGLWLTFYPCAYVFIVLKLRSRISRLQAGVWLEGLIATLGTAALAAAFVLGLAVTDTRGSVETVATNLAYPVGDLVLLSVILGAFGLFSWHPPAVWWIAGLGMVFFAVADGTYLFEVSRDAYQPGTWLDLTWAGGVSLVALAAIWPEDARTFRPAASSAGLVVPLFFSLTSVALLAVASREHVPVAAILLASATIVAAGVRTWLTVREVSQLADTRRLSRTDDLTGLPNRRHFHAAVASAVAGEQPQVAVMLMDLDRFKDINDSLGHHIGDEILSRLGRRMTAALHDQGLLARLGGDEFGILLLGADENQATELAARLLSTLRGRFEIEGLTLHVDASIGIAVYPDHANGVSRLLQCADIAMYRAKAAHTGYEVSDPDADSVDRQRLETIEDLRHALERDEFVLHYQPKLDLRTQTITGVEALVRWQHVTRGLLYPDTFLPLVEHSGLMRRLTMIVVEVALRQADSWRDAGWNLPVAVNLSASNLLDAQLPEQISTLLTTLSVPPELLELEITETVLMADPIRANQVLRALRTLGIRLAVDDYGTGYSSLAYLHNLPVDDLKIDRSFIMRSATDARAAAIVRSTIDLAHSLDMKVIAEGVETADALARLVEAGCDIAQGHHICRPRNATQLESWLALHPQLTPNRAHTPY